MSTNLTIIRDALGLLGVLAEVETPSAEQGEHGLRILNEMMEQWRVDGVEVGQWPQNSVNDESPLGQYTLPAVKYQLAAALGPYYGKRLLPEDVARGERLYTQLVRDAMVAKMEPASMTHLPGVYSDWDILTGE